MNARVCSVPVCVLVCACVCGGVHMHLYIYRGKMVMSGISLNCSPAYLFESRSVTEPDAFWLDRLPDQ